MLASFFTEKLMPQRKEFGNITAFSCRNYYSKRQNYSFWLLETGNGWHSDNLYQALSRINYGKTTNHIWFAKRL